MPTYDYSCDACHHEFEVFESISVDPQKKCPKCKKNKLRRLFGAGAGLIFKGSGFYQTDYRSESYKKAADAEKPKSESSSSSESSSKSETAKSESGKSETGKSETKSSGAAKSESKPKKPKS
jgi:putative FmdB family regulatory protein